MSGRLLFSKISELAYIKESSINMVTSIFLQQLFVFQSDCSCKLPSMPTCAESTEGASTEGTQLRLGLLTAQGKNSNILEEKHFCSLCSEA